MNLANEGLEARKKEEEVAAKKRKAEEDKDWEGARTFCRGHVRSTHRLLARREERVDSWRSFSQPKKKKKTKVQLLG